MEPLVEPRLEQVLEFCARDPIERVFLEDVARRGYGRFVGVEDGDGIARRALPSRREPRAVGRGLRRVRRRGRRRRLEDDHRRTSGPSASSGRAAGRRMPEPRADRPGQPVYAIAEPPEPGGTRAAAGDARRPRAADPGLRRGARGRARRRSARARRRRLPLADARADRRGALVALVRGRRCVLFKAEASAWTPTAVQVQQVWVDPRGARAAATVPAACATSAGCCSASAPFVTLFVRTENAPAIALYESIGHGPRRPLPLAALLAWSARSSPGTARASSACAAILNGDVSVPGGLTPDGGRAGAGARRRARAASRSTSASRASSSGRSQTADEALAGRDVPRLVVPGLERPALRRLRGRDARRVPGVGAERPRRRRQPGRRRREPRRRSSTATRGPTGALLERPEETILVVCHSLPVSYALARPRRQRAGRARAARRRTRRRTRSRAGELERRRRACSSAGSRRRRW